MRCLVDEYEELMSRDPRVRELVDRVMSAVIVAEKALRILGEIEEALREEYTETSDRTSHLKETCTASILTTSLSEDIGPRRLC